MLESMQSSVLGDDEETTLSPFSKTDLTEEERIQARDLYSLLLEDGPDQELALDVIVWMSVSEWKQLTVSERKRIARDGAYRLMKDQRERRRNPKRSSGSKRTNGSAGKRREERNRTSKNGKRISGRRRSKGRTDCESASFRDLQKKAAEQDWPVRRNKKATLKKECIRRYGEGTLSPPPRSPTSLESYKRRKREAEKRRRKRNKQH